MFQYLISFSLYTNFTLDFEFLFNFYSKFIDISVLNVYLTIYNFAKHDKIVAKNIDETLFKLNISSEEFDNSLKILQHFDLIKIYQNNQNKSLHYVIQKPIYACDMSETLRNNIILASNGKLTNDSFINIYENSHEYINISKKDISINNTINDNILFVLKEINTTRNFILNFNSFEITLINQLNVFSKEIIKSLLLNSVKNNSKDEFDFKKLQELIISNKNYININQKDKFIINNKIFIKNCLKSDEIEKIFDTYKTFDFNNFMFNLTNRNFVPSELDIINSLRSNCPLKDEVYKMIIHHTVVICKKFNISYFKKSCESAYANGYETLDSLLAYYDYSSTKKPQLDEKPITKLNFFDS